MCRRRMNWFGLGAVRVTKAADWKVGAGRDFEVQTGAPKWDGAVAQMEIFRHAGFDGDDPDFVKARRCFLVYDASRPGDQKGAYKAPFCRIVDGKPVVPDSFFAASGRVGQMDIPRPVLDRAQEVVRYYMAKRDEEEEKD